MLPVKEHITLIGVVGSRAHSISFFVYIFGTFTFSFAKTIVKVGSLGLRMGLVTVCFPNGSISYLRTVLDTCWDMMYISAPVREVNLYVPGTISLFDCEQVTILFAIEHEEKT